MDKSVNWPFNYTIDGVDYAIYSCNETDDMLYDDVENSFDNLVCEVPIHWREYINKDKWIEENIISDFKAWFFKKFIKDLTNYYNKDFCYIFKKYE